MTDTNERRKKSGDKATAESARKIRLLKLWLLLEQKTDPENPLTTQEILSNLEEMGLSCDRRTLSKDINILNKYDFEVMSVDKGHGKAYYVDDRTFQFSEIRLLMDAVRSARFLTEDKTNDLVDKIASLAGDHRADMLKNKTLVAKNPKHSNEQIYYNINTLSEAIEKKLMVKFRYFHLNEKREKIYHHEESDYIISPITLQYDEDQYYVIGCRENDEFYGKIYHYRLDRMEKAEILDRPIDTSAEFNQKDIEKYTRPLFRMFSGEFETVTLEFSDKLIGVIYDKFGEDTTIRKTDENLFSATVEIQISPTFFGWIFQFAGDMKIRQPAALVNDYRRRCMETYRSHEAYCQVL